MSKKIKNLLSVIMAVTMMVTSLAPLTTFGASKTSSKYASGEAIAVMSAGNAAYTARDITLKYGSSIKYKSSHNFDNGLDMVVVRSSTMSTENLIKMLNRDPSVKYAFPNYKMKASTVTNDTLSSFQWALDNQGQINGDGISDVNAENIWTTNSTSTDENVVVICDSGVNYNHPDLKNIMWKNPYGKKLLGKYGYDFANGDADPMDDLGHGTHCAGIVAAESDNEEGISGICRGNTKIMALKWLDDAGSGYTDDYIACCEYIERAVDLGVNIVAVNNSWGGYGDAYEASTLKDIFDSLGEKGIVSVCAAGNEYTDIDSDEQILDIFGDLAVNIPAQCGSDYQIVVAASTSNGKLVSFSNYGNKTVDVCAPGSNILSTVAYNTFNPTIYNDDQITALCKDYQSYDSAVGASDFGYFDFNGNSDVTISQSDNFFGNSGKSQKITFASGSKRGKKYVAVVPFTLGDEDKDYSVSFVANNIGVDCDVFDVPYSKDISNLNELIEENIDCVYFYSDYGDDWVHDTYKISVEDFSKNLDYEKDTNRKLVFVFTVYSDNAWVELDDFAISNQNINEDDFGMYDFYSGTSMATPYVAGAVSLVKTALGNKAVTLDVINVVKNCGRIQSDLEGKTKNQKTLDLSDITKVPPTIYSIKYLNGNVVIDGKFDTVSQFMVNDNAASYEISTDKTKITINGKGHLNRKIKVTVGNSYGSVTKEALLTNSKAFSLLKDCEITINPVGIVMPAGDVTYILSQDGCLSTVQYDEFAKNYYTDVDYDFGLYNIGLDEENIYIDSATYLDNCIYMTINCPLISSSNYVYGYNSYFYKYNLSTAKFKKLCNLPNESIEGATLTSYNGCVYLIGGYDISNSAYSKDVYKLNSAEKEFTKTYSLHSGVAYADAVQQSGRLVLIGGACSTDKMPVIQSFNGSSWRKSSKELDRDECEKNIFSNGDSMSYYDVQVSSSASGLLCTGSFYKDLGMSLLYNPVDDTYKSYDYCYKGDNAFIIVPAGKSIVAFDLAIPDDDKFGEESSKAYNVPLKRNVVEINNDYGNFTLQGPVSSYAEYGDKLTYKVTTPYGYVAQKLLVTDNNTTKTSSYTLTNGKASFVANANSYTVSAKVERVSPGDISSVKVSKISGKKCTLTWSKASNAEGYAVQKYANGSWSTVKSLNKNTASYTVTAKTGNNKYRIRAYRTYNGKKYYSYSGTKAIYVPKQQKITSLAAGKGKFTVKYNKDTNATGYQVKYSTSSKMTKSVTKTVNKNSTVSVTASKLKTSKKYYVKVRSYKTVNGQKIYGAWSKVKSIKTK